MPWKGSARSNWACIYLNHLLGLSAQSLQAGQSKAAPFNGVPVMSDRHLTAVKHLNSRSSSRKRKLRSQVLTTSKSGWNGLKYFCYVKKCLHTGTSAGSFVDALHCKILPEQTSDLERGAGEMVHKSQKKKKKGGRGLWSLPVVLFLAANLKAIVQRERLVSVPVCQFNAENVLPLAGQLVNVLVPQPVLRRRASKPLKSRRTKHQQEVELTLELLAKVRSGVDDDDDDGCGGGKVCVCAWSACGDEEWEGGKVNMAHSWGLRHVLQSGWKRKWAPPPSPTPFFL